MTKILMIIVAIALILHGLIHLMGTAIYARRPEINGLSYKTTLLSGHWDLGQSGIAVFGWLWLLPAVGFVAGAVALLAGWAWWNPVLVGITLVSLTLTVLDWSSAFRGAVIDVAILALIVSESTNCPLVFGLKILTVRLVAILARSGVTSAKGAYPWQRQTASVSRGT